MLRLSTLACIATLMTAQLAMAQHDGKARKSGLVSQVSGQGYGMAGCGLGSILFGTQHGPVQILAATTNGTFGNQTFGITSGTSNCVESGAVQNAKAVTVFIEANRIALANDIAKGNGEYLASLAQLLNCNNASSFNHQMQKNYKSIFPQAETSPQQVETTIRTLIHSQSALAQNCIG